MIVHIPKCNQHYILFLFFFSFVFILACVLKVYLSLVFFFLVFHDYQYQNVLPNVLILIARKLEICTDHYKHCFMVNNLSNSIIPYLTPYTCMLSLVLMNLVNKYKSFSSFCFMYHYTYSYFIFFSFHS